MNQALYRKYRPKNFDDLKGQEIVNKILINTITHNKEVHAYIFYGPRGTGKTSTAKLFSRAINCENPVNGSPCEKCDSCKITADVNVDIIEMDAASNNGVDEVRNLNEMVLVAPSNLKYKIYIIDEVQMLTNSAYNALLKTIEEPPKHVIFIFATTELEKIPNTILSRCQVLEFRRLSSEVVSDNLLDIAKKEKVKITKDAAMRIAKLSNGGMRDAIGMLDKAITYKNDKKIELDDINKITGNVSEEKIKKIVELIRKEKFLEIIKLLNEYLLENNDVFGITKDIVEKYSNLKFEEINFEILGTLNKILNEAKYSEFPEIPLMVYFSKLYLESTNNISVTKKEPSEERAINVSVRKKENKFLEELINARVNNCFVGASKDQKIRLNIEKSKFYTYEGTEEEKKFIEIINDAIIEMASEDIIVLTHNIENIVKECNKNLEIVENIFKKVLQNDYKLVFVDNNRWNQEKKKFIIKQKNNEPYTIIDEPIKEKKITSEFEENVHPIVSEVIEMFGKDKVEVSK